MIVLIALIAIVVLAGVFVLLTYNRLVRLRLAAENSFSQIDVALRLRHDLVPRLVEAVRGYAGHERTTLENTTQARASAMSAGASGPAQRAAAEGILTAGLSNLLVNVEAYPELRATENFMALQKELSSVEERISITRRVYNDTVETYNTAIQVFPSNLVAGAFSFTRREFFDAPVAAETAPTVSMETPSAVEPPAGQEGGS